MNFEYKVGYLWKSYEEDPGQRSWNGEILRKPLGRNEESARADYWYFAYRQFSASGWQLARYFGLIWRFRRRLGRGQPWENHFSFLFFSFLLLLFPSLLFSLPHLCWLLDVAFRGSPSARMEKVKAWKLSGLAESFADVCRKLRFEVPAQIQYKIL